MKKSTDEIDNRELSAGIKDPYVRVACAMMAWASKESRQGDEVSACWLLDEQAKGFTEIAELGKLFPVKNIEKKIRFWFRIV